MKNAPHQDGETKEPSELGEVRWRRCQAPLVIGAWLAIRAANPFGTPRAATPRREWPGSAPSGYDVRRADSRRWRFKDD